jgi:probable rRNA maturation factor
MTIHLDVQIVSKNTGVPEEAEFHCWANAVPVKDQSSACLRIVDEPEAKNLNKKYRNIDKATNVLSFPAEIPSQLGINFLGDIVICAPIVDGEAKQHNKNPSAHWAHLLVHGLLHLQGYDHEDEQTAEVMESKEIKILHKLNISNPYI